MNAIRAKFVILLHFVKKHIVLLNCSFSAFVTKYEANKRQCNSSTVAEVKGTLPPSKKLMNWHESDVARFRKSKNEYLPNFIEKYSPVFKILDFYFCLLFGISAVPSDFI